MSVSYNVFTGAFLAKITEFEFIQLGTENRTTIIDGYMKRAISEFKYICKYDLSTTGDDETRQFDVDIDEADLIELMNIISEGMVVQWLKTYLYKQELLESVLNTRDFSTYSPAELLMRVGNAYNTTQSNYIQMMREYSYSHGDLTDLHL